MVSRRKPTDSVAMPYPRKFQFNLPNGEWSSRKVGYKQLLCRSSCYNIQRVDGKNSDYWMEWRSADELLPNSRVFDLKN